MLFLIFVLVVLAGFILLSYGVHEYSHAGAAKLLGWETHGMTIRWYGAGYKIKIKEDNPRDIWKIAAAGLLGTAILGTLGFLLSLVFPIFFILFILNFFIFIFNIVPLKGLDGYYLANALIEYFQHPSGLRS